MDVKEKQLDYLNETMKETAAAANSFLLKYHFGGLIAVIALLNADLVLAEEILEICQENYRVIWLALAVLLIFTLSSFYFSIVLVHYKKFKQSHRKLKYKYELTLHWSLCNGETRDYQLYMEKSVTNRPALTDTKEDKLCDHNGKNYEFTAVASYLLNHHRIKYQNLNKIDLKYLFMALSVIALTMSIRVMFLLV